jgi:hypothetical protein
MQRGEEPRPEERAVGSGAWHPARHEAGVVAVAREVVGHGVVDEEHDEHPCEEGDVRARGTDAIDASRRERRERYPEHSACGEAERERH